MVLFGSDTIRKILFIISFILLIIISITSKKENDILILVNKENPISTSYSPNIKSYKGFYMAKEVIEPLKEMEDSLNRADINYKIKEAYTSVKMQELKFNSKIKEYQKSVNDYEAKLKAASEVLLPRYSEHHTALALDFEGNDDLYEWLDKNAYKYGFILRYPKGKEDITGYEYNRGHYRYVGTYAALDIKKNNLCLEEYLNKEEI